MPETVFNRHKRDWLQADADFLVDTYRALLVRGSVTIDADDNFVSDFLAVNTELTDVSYARQTLGTKTVTQNDTDDRGDADCANIDFGSLDNETPTAMLIYRFVTVDADSPCMAVYDTNFGSASNGAGYVVETPNDILRAS